MMRFFVGLVGGFLLACLATLVVGYALVNTESPSTGTVLTFFLAWPLSLIAAISAPTTAKACRRLLLPAAVVSFLSPFSMLVFTGTYLATKTTSAAGAAGAAMGGATAIGVAGIVGWSLAATFLAVGLRVGRDKQAIVVQAPSVATPPSS